MRATLRSWLVEATEAVDPEALTAKALARSAPDVDTVIAIGKAAPAMCRGAARVLGPIRGVCVAAGPSEVPEGIELLIGDHPIPGDSSFEAGHRVLEAASAAAGGCLVLVSGGGSALSEWPRPGVEKEYLQEVNERLLTGGASIEEANLVRGHLSALKCGGLARAGDGPYHTYVLSDVAGAGPEVVASGPTLPMRYDPERAKNILTGLGVAVPPEVWEAMVAKIHDRAAGAGPVTVIGDGMTAASALRDAAVSHGVEARVRSGWLAGEVSAAVAAFLDQSERGVTVATGETSLVVAARGRGGRNTHAALLAAIELKGTSSIFAAFATDGKDGKAEAAGAIVDGGTVRRGGDPSESLRSFDSASYLERTGDLIHTGPTGTNVADLWVLWHP